ncbi:hypothetical protein HanRHA438_Chr10g0466491 [Helianthus annuus]|uniref:Uncharacterized protein n=1 Tax=Helianthus annuus TaxID=4232 RepID=A0A251TME7_HELAN|nr:hypothetical protein HanXRQr2_Chr10g0453671 [Helianthus annuus]KAJ0514730.1 hypothetical protein HanHA300_Chr10g0372901 [Helianthus annuus]KAJ0523007.1 hypothetical protein HanIR_Chr10g0489051 [Helianthus annuus]KAJ0530884.1 hypothetical protein HanHA89_Chr10g0395021 [Helianthus annuus]KAJ0701109.1 hypothetical protein HanOQP8_Chr10g0375791 [Helianthus annuus]
MRRGGSTSMHLTESETINASRYADRYFQICCLMRSWRSTCAQYHSTEVLWERRANHRNTGRCGQGRLLDRRQPLGSLRCAETRPPPARRHDSGIIGKTSPPSKTNQRHPYSPFTRMPQK